MLKNYQKELCRKIQSLGYKYDTNRVFCDFVECSAIEISNSVDPLHKEEREKRYIEIMKAYDKLEERQKFCEMFADLVMALEEIIRSGTGPEDVLGPVFHELELHNQYKGQFFTPQSVSDMMGYMSIGEYEKAIEENGYVTVGEPACGSGGMVFSFAKAMMERKHNYCTQMVVTATDVDLKCVHMAYIQLSLYGIPAVVIHGNTLTMEEWSRWYTPVYLIDKWIWRTPYSLDGRRNRCDERLKITSEPMYGIMRYGLDIFKNPDRAEERIRAEQPEAPPAKFDIELKEDKNGQLKFDIGKR